MPVVAVIELTSANDKSASTMLQCKPGMAELEFDPDMALRVRCRVIFQLHILVVCGCLALRLFLEDSDDSKQQHKLAGTRDRHTSQVSTAVIKRQLQICKAAMAIPHKRALSQICEGHRDGELATCAGLFASAYTVLASDFIIVLRRYLCVTACRVVRTDIEFPSSPSGWQDVIPEHPKDLLDWAAALKVTACSALLLQHCTSAWHLLPHNLQ